MRISSLHPPHFAFRADCGYGVFSPSAFSGSSLLSVACVGEASNNVGESLIRRIAQFTTEDGIRTAAVRRGRKQGVDRLVRPKRR